MRQFLIKQRTKKKVLLFQPFAIFSAEKKGYQNFRPRVLMLLRAYQVNPCLWERILESIQENTHTLPSDAKTLYSSATQKQLKDRLSTKLGKLLLTPADKMQIY